MGLIELEARKAPRIRPWKEKKIALLYASKTEVFYDIFWNEYAQGILAAFEEHPEYKVAIFNIATAGSAAIAEAIEKENYCGIISLGYQYFDRDNFRHLNEFGLPMVFTGPDPMEGTVNFCPEFSAALNEIAERLQFPELPVPLYCLHTRSGLKNVTYSEKFYQTGKMLQKHFGISISKDDIAQRERMTTISLSLHRLRKNCVAENARTSPSSTPTASVRSFSALCMTQVCAVRKILRCFPSTIFPLRNSRFPH